MNTKLQFPLTPDSTSLVDILSKRAFYQPEQIAYTFLQDGNKEEVRITYKELDRRAKLIAALLQNLGLAGKRALLLYPPGLEFISAFCGCLYAKVVAVPAYPPRRNQLLERFQTIVKDSQATEVLTTTSVWKNVERSFAQHPELASLRWLATDNLASNLARSWQEPTLNSDTLAFLQYTSGSTGTPKGVMVSHTNLLNNLSRIQQEFGHTANSRGVIWLPPYHDMGLIGGILQPLYVGFPVTLMSPVAFLQKPLRWLQTISNRQATTSGGPNFAYDLCVRKITPEQREELNLSSWEVAFTGAEPVRAETLEQFADTFAECGFRREAFYPCYGMAESTLFVTGARKTGLPVTQSVEEAALEENQAVFSHEIAGTRKLVGAGKSRLNHKVITVDPDHLTKCSANRVGEIWVSGPSVALGYWQQPKQTEQTFNAYTADTGEGPFLRTGDLGFIREDGELFVTGRLKDIIIIRGRNHYPQDVELTVEKSHAALKPSCVAAFAIEKNSQEKLVVVAEVERTHLRRLNENEIVGDIRQALAAKHGLQVHAAVLVKPGSIPKTSSGKIRRSTCRTKFLEGTLAIANAKRRSEPRSSTLSPIAVAFT